LDCVTDSGNAGVKHVVGDGKLLKQPRSIKGYSAHDDKHIPYRNILPSTAFCNTLLYWPCSFGSTTVIKLTILRFCFCSPSSSMGMVRSSVLNWHGHWVLVGKCTLIWDKWIVSFGC
jgi:hypothetical protein